MPKVFTRAIRPRKTPWPPKPAPVYRVLEKAMENEVKPLIISYFDKIVESWNGKPVFQARMVISQTEITLYVYPTGPNALKWTYVSGGTKPHPIKPKGRGYKLKFVWGGPGSYKPKTTTSGGYKGPGKVIGGQPVEFWAVKHPGNKPRNFEKHIARWSKTKVKRILDNAMKRCSRLL